MIEERYTSDGRPVASVQEHLGYVRTKYSGVNLDEDRERSHAKEVPDRPPYPDVYVNGDVTVTVDPVGNSQWIRDDGHGHRHVATQHRGALKDHAGVMRTRHLLDQHAAPPFNFVPTTHMLDNSLKFSARCVANSTRGNPAIGRNENAGKLPVISALQYANRLADKPDWLVEWEQYAPTHNRAFDCDGWCR